MTIEWGKIVTNAISTLVAALVISAAAIVWNGVSTIGSRIEEAKLEINVTQSEIKASVEILSEDIFDLQDEIDGLRTELSEHNDNIAEPMGEQIHRGSRDMRQETMSDKIKTKASTYK